nr:hypothetical protein CFP56_19665 [Quercus suber]
MRESMAEPSASAIILWLGPARFTLLTSLRHSRHTLPCDSGWVDLCGRLSIIFEAPHGPCTLTPSFLVQHKLKHCARLALHRYLHILSQLYCPGR